jgi:hypothetical protein
MAGELREEISRERDTIVHIFSESFLQILYNSKDKGNSVTRSVAVGKRGEIEQLFRSLPKHRINEKFGRANVSLSS